MSKFHVHHILPKHAGGTDEPNNLIRVTIEEHAELHLSRYLSYGDMGDWIAAFALSGHIGKTEAIALARLNFLQKNPNHLSEAGKKGAAARREQGVTERVREAAKEVAKELGKMPWWNNGVVNSRSYECPGEGFVKGKLPHENHTVSEILLSTSLQNIESYNSRPFEERSRIAKANAAKQSKEGKVKGGQTGGKMPFWNNGLNNKRSHTCPGEGYVRGKLPVGRINQPKGTCPHCGLITTTSNLTRHISSKHS